MRLAWPAAGDYRYRRVRRVPARAWYFEQNGAPTMPLAIVMEAALQPCGWLATYVGSVLESQADPAVPNLDGTADGAA